MAFTKMYLLEQIWGENMAFNKMYLLEQVWAGKYGFY